jgi:hypothetical protein
VSAGESVCVHSSCKRQLLQSCVVCDVLCCTVISELDSYICSVAHDQCEQHAAAWLASNNEKKRTVLVP